tara:strand:- start:170 stop:1015 length:846 start_codon:yes stop_codon:yes gene_type:complete
MNIHIEDEVLFEELKRISVFNIEIGSRMYGTNNEESDRDILYIYIPSQDEMNSISSSHHQYQFKENGIDHIFTDIFTFIKNTLNGDSTINFEVINSEKIEHSNLDWLVSYRDYFRNYKILRAYLGRARKDLKQMKSMSNIKDCTKKVSHGIRCYQFACDVLENSFQSLWDDKYHYDILATTRAMTNKRKVYELASEYEMKISVLRERVNHLLDSGKLGMEQYMSKEAIVKLDLSLSMFVSIARAKQEFKHGESNYYNNLRYLVASAIADGIDYGDSSIKVK